MRFVYLGFDATPWKVTVNRDAIRRQLGFTDAFMIVGYGRPGVSKGFKYLVDSVPKITASIPNARVLLMQRSPTIP